MWWQSWHWKRKIFVLKTQKYNNTFRHDIFYIHVKIIKTYNKLYVSMFSTHNHKKTHTHTNLRSPKKLISRSCLFIYVCPYVRHHITLNDHMWFIHHYRSLNEHLWRIYWPLDFLKFIYVLQMCFSKSVWFPYFANKNVCHGLSTSKTSNIYK